MKNRKAQSPVGTKGILPEAQIVFLDEVFQKFLLRYVPMLVIATTNRLDIIDEALLRPSRFKAIAIKVIHELGELAPTNSPNLTFQ